MTHGLAIKKKRRVSRRPPHLDLLDRRMSQLRQVERRMDALFRQVVDRLSQEEASCAWEQLDALVSRFVELRFTDIDRYPDRVTTLLLHLDPEIGPLPGFHESVERLCKEYIQPQDVCWLRSQLYTVAAQVAETCPELLPTVALAVLSLDGHDQTCNPFVEMVVCASAIESLDMVEAERHNGATLDVGTWLAAEPSDALVEAVGEKRAYYYAAIPGVLPFLDSHSVLFDVQRLVPYARTLFGARAWHNVGMLGSLVNQRYKSLLYGEIERVRSMLQERYPAGLIGDVEMLIQRALESLEELPPQVNPLLQAILVQSWVYYLGEVC